MTARFGRSSTPMILIDRKGLSPELLLISDGEFFKAPDSYEIPEFRCRYSWDLACTGDSAVFVCVCNEVQDFLKCRLNEA